MSPSASEHSFDVFFSHSREDRPRALPLIHALEAAGFKVWWDGLLETGTQYTRTTEQALKSAAAVVVLWTKTSTASHWVRDEAMHGRDRGCLVPLSIDGSEPPLGFRQFQVTDLTRWNGKVEAPELVPVLHAIRALLPVDAVANGAAPSTHLQSLPPAAATRLPRFAMPALALLLLAAVGGTLWWWRQPTKPVASNSVAATPVATTPVAAGSASVAVLPFANLSGDASKDYLGDGLSEELINTLTKIPGLKVPARTSSFAYKGRHTDIRQIARDLGVANVLDGSVRIAGKELRITAELISAADGSHIWSQTYDRPFAALFKLEEELASAIAGAMKKSLGGQLTVAAAKAPATKDVEAYTLTLQGFGQLQALSRQGVHNALNLFQQAIVRDPGYARPHAGRAIALISSSRASDGQALQSILVDAAQAARHALQLDPNSAEAETALGDLAFARYDMVEAEDHYRRAEKLDPSDAQFQFNHAKVQAYVGHLREAVQTMRGAYALAPAVPAVAMFTGGVHAWAGRDAEALKYANVAISLGIPKDGVGEIFGLAAMRAKRYDEYLHYEFIQYPGESSADIDPARELTRLVIAALADPAKRATASAARLRLYPKGGSLTGPGSNRCGYDGTRAYVLLGDLDAAFDLANQCLDEAPAGTTWGNSCPWTPEWRNFRKDPRFQAYIARRGAIPYYEKYGPPDDCDFKDGKLSCH